MVCQCDSVENPHARQWFSRSFDASPRKSARLRPNVEAMRAAILDLRYELVHIADGGDLVSFHTRVTARHRASVRPGARREAVLRRQMQIERVRDGMIAEQWRLTDEAAMHASWAGES